ncbi:MAG: pantoate--beta-alanine ligase [Hyphomicrobiaceae bacterium]
MAIGTRGRGLANIDYVSRIQDLHRCVDAWRRAGESIALLPTMGALHEGHLSLARIGRAHCRRLIASIFVNPTQFAPSEDFSSYPRTLENDLAKLDAIGCDLVWAPGADAMYPDRFATSIVPLGAASGLEADFRPQFFTGVATVCCKLFLQTQPHVALFGEKDYQQLCVVRQMVRDLNLRLEIVAGPTIREPDGLAMSSRNAYLSAKERKIAAAIHPTLLRAAAAFRDGLEPKTATEMASRQLVEAGFDEIDYVAIRDSETLHPVPRGSKTAARVLAAARLGTTRLIDNIDSTARV